jgi:sporulation protein YlmC with PRC-barrel domain
MDISSPEDVANTWTGKRVLDSDGQEIGVVDAIWLDPSTFTVEFAGVQTGPVFGKTYLVPARMIAPFQGDDTIRLLCPVSLVKTAPAFVPGLELAEIDKEQIDQHYKVQVPDQRVTDIQEVRPGEGLNPGQAEPPKGPASLALTEPPLHESEHTAAERAFPTERPLEHWINEAHG